MSSPTLVVATTRADLLGDKGAPDASDRAAWKRRARLAAAAHARARADGRGALGAGIAAAVARVQATFPARVYAHYTEMRGNQFAASTAYFSLFSLFSALVVAVAVFAIVLADYPDIRDAAFDALYTWLPGIESLVPSTDSSAFDFLRGGFSLAAVLSGVVLLVTSVGAIGALGQGLRAVAERPSFMGNPVLAKLVDLLALVLIGVGLVLTTALSTAARWFADIFAAVAAGTAPGPVVSAVATASSIVGGLLADFLLAFVVIRVVGRLKFGRRYDLEAFAIAAVGLSVLRFLGVALLGQASANPILASAAILVGLLIWFNLLSRVLLLATSWATLRLIDARSRTLRRTVVRAADGTVAVHAAVASTVPLGPPTLAQYRAEHDAGRSIALRIAILLLALVGLNRLIAQGTSALARRRVRRE